ncbi:MAG: response regulator [Rhizobiaceae bacterium]|nr:response regulator [Rhizobiaceae bacterium]
MRVLLVEDNAIIGNAVRDHLRAEGWEVDWAMDLQSARMAVAKWTFDIILLDLRLPDGSGLDFLRQVVSRPDRMPVIVMSAYDQLSDQMTGLAVGAVDYLVKPFGLGEMLARIRRATAPRGVEKSSSHHARALHRVG